MKRIIFLLAGISLFGFGCQNQSIVLKPSDVEGIKNQIVQYEQILVKSIPIAEACAEMDRANFLKAPSSAMDVKKSQQLSDKYKDTCLQYSAVNKLFTELPLPHPVLLRSWNKLVDLNSRIEEVGNHVMVVQEYKGWGSNFADDIKNLAGRTKERLAEVKQAYPELLKPGENPKDSVPKDIPESVYDMFDTSCGNVTCFEKKYAQCEKGAWLTVITPIGTINYTIQGLDKEYCQVKQRGAIHPDGGLYSQLDTMVCQLKSKTFFGDKGVEGEIDNILRGEKDMSLCKGSLADYIRKSRQEMMSGGG